MFIGGFELSPQFTQWFTSIFDKIDEAVNPVVNYFNPAFEYVIQLLNFLGKYIIWVFSYLGLSYEVLFIIFGIIGSGIGLIISSFVIKLVVKWWSVLVP